MCRATIRAAWRNITACSAANTGAACELYDLTGKIGRAVNDPDPLHHRPGTMTTQGNDWTVDTTYKFLRWEDIIRKDFARPVVVENPAHVPHIRRTLLNGVQLAHFAARIGASGSSSSIRWC